MVTKFADIFFRRLDLYDLFWGQNGWKKLLKGAICREESTDVTVCENAGARKKNVVTLNARQHVKHVKCHK